MTINVLATAPSLVYYYNDAAGSPIAAADANGTPLWIETYMPYGERYLKEDTGTTNGVWYTGKPTEDTTGLSYLGARWYNPAIGRFYAVDPQAFRDSNALSFNRYVYANNNPYRFTDPDGYDPLSIFDQIAADKNYLAATACHFGCHGIVSDPERRMATPTEVEGLVIVNAALTLGASTGATLLRAASAEAGAIGAIHKNSLAYVGETHVYRIIGPNGKTYKIGESAQGVRLSDGASIRAEQQARKLARETGDVFQTEIRKVFPDKASARDYETRLIERFRSMYGDDASPGNLTNR